MGERNIHQPDSLLMQDSLRETENLSKDPSFLSKLKDSVSAKVAVVFTTLGISSSCSDTILGAQKPEGAVPGHVEKETSGLKLARYTFADDSDQVDVALFNPFDRDVAVKITPDFGAPFEATITAEGELQFDVEEHVNSVTIMAEGGFSETIKRDEPDKFAE